MKALLVAAIGLCVTPVIALAAPAKHFPSGGSRASGPTPAYSAAVELDGTLYISGTADGTDPDTGKLPADATTGAKVVMNSIKRIVETAGYTMDDIYGCRSPRPTSAITATSTPCTGPIQGPAAGPRLHRRRQSFGRGAFRDLRHRQEGRGGEVGAMRHFALAGLGAVALAFSATVAPAADSKAAANDRSRFIGTWDLVSVEAQWPDGHVNAPWGAHLAGAPDLYARRPDPHLAVLDHELRNQASHNDVTAALQNEAAGISAPTPWIPRGIS